MKPDRDAEVVGGAELDPEQVVGELVAQGRVADDAAAVARYPADLTSMQCSKKWSSSSTFRLWSWL